MHTEVTEAGPFERLLTLHVDEAELEVAKDQAARKLSKQLKIKGFRPGKAPRAVVERMVGSDALRSEALDDALPELVGSAIETTDLEPVTAPAVEEVRDRDGGGVDVDVRVTLWPTLEEVPDLARTVEVDPPSVDDDELAAQVDRVRSQYAELEDVSRAAGDGDFVLVNLSATSSLGAPVEEVAASDLLYEVGSRSYIPGLDEVLAGSSAGDIRDGPAVLPDGFGDHAGSEVTLRALVKGVKARRLPELTDDWVSDVSEFDTVEELTDQLRENLLVVKRNAARSDFRDRVLDAIIDELDLDLPDALVQAEMETAMHNLVHSLQARGIDLGTYLAVTGQTQDGFLSDLRSGSEHSLRVRILLEAVAEAEGIEVTDHDLTEVVAEMAQRSGRATEELHDVLTQSGQDRALTGDILRRRALQRVLDASEAVDSEGNPVDLTVEVDELIYEADDLEEPALEDVAEGDTTEQAGDQDTDRDDDEDS